MTSGSTVERVAFGSAGEELVGDLYLPTSSNGARRPAVVVAGAWGTVKEQMAAGYAREMAARGVIALAFDFRSWGKSSGQPRSMEDPYAKAADIVAAAEFLATHPAVDADADAVGGLAICAGCSYLALAAAEASGIKSLAFVAPALPTRADVLENLGGETNMAALVDAACEAMAEYGRTGQQTLVPAVDGSAESVAGQDYYTNVDRGMIPEWDNTFNLASWSTWAQFDVHSVATKLGQPLVVVHSDAAVNPESVRAFVAKVPVPVEQLWLDAVPQFDFYDQPGAMGEASDAASAHFARTLS